MSLVRNVGAAVVVLVALLVVGWLLGIFAAPTVGVQDVGDWGTVSEDRTEIVTTVWVNNPNPVGVQLGGLGADYSVSLNGVTIAEGSRSGISIQQGNQTKRIRTELLNDRLPDWWVEYVRADETIDARFDGSVNVDAGVASTSLPVSKSWTLQRNATPVIDAFSQAASNAEGSYPRGGPALYEVRDAYATWGSVNESATMIDFHFEIHNPNVVPIPAAPDGLAAEIDMNDVAMVRTQGNAFTLQNVGPDETIAPGETREVVMSVRLDNQKIDEWFVSHVERGERTELAVRLQLLFRLPGRDTTIRVPQEALAYTCEMQTAILVDDQRTQTTCGSPGSAAPSTTAPSVVDGTVDGRIAP